MPGMLGRMSLGERIGFSGNRFEKSLMTKLDGRWNAGTVPDVVEYGSNKHSHAKARRRKGIQEKYFASLRLCVRLFSEVVAWMRGFLYPRVRQ
jgi:hypothetical protein